MVRWTRFSRYMNEHADRAAAAYAQVASRHGLNMAQMSLAFVRQQRFVASVLLGATSMEQLKTNLGSAAVTLGPEVYEGHRGRAQVAPQPLSVAEGFPTRTVGLV